jgi:signal peptidase I
MSLENKEKHSDIETELTTTSSELEAAKPEKENLDTENSETAEDEDKPVWPGVIQWFKDLSLAAALCVLLIVFVIQPFRVDKTSMEPLLYNGDRILVSKISLWFEPIRRGDIVVLMNPRQPNENWIKRVIGLPGEVVQMDEGVFYINGLPLNESYIPEVERASKNVYPPMNIISFAGSFQGSTAESTLEELGLVFLEPWETRADFSVAVRIPEGYYFVAGDHRRYSMDSRDSIYIRSGNGPGLIPERYIYGKAVFRYWPLDSIGFIPAPDYEKPSDLD